MGRALTTGLSRVLLAGLAAVGLCGAAAAAEVIERFVSDIELRADGALHVTETIQVRAEGDQIRRGIYRDLPLTFVDAEGHTRRVGFRLLSVTRNGAPEPHFTRWSRDGVRIYAGAEDVFIARGTHTYAFRYQTDRQIRTFDGEAELNWNVTGNEWIFPILYAEARLRLPDGAQPTRWTAYTGRFGARGEDWQASLDNDVLRVSTTQRLRQGEGLTIVAALPPGIVAEPGMGRRLTFLYLDYQREALLAFGLGAILLYYLFMWDAVGRDPKRGIIIPLFSAPEGVSPALASYIHERGWADGGWRAFTAGALSLAVKGLVLFDEERRKLRLKRTDRPRPPDLPPGERALAAWLERRDGAIDVTRANGEAVQAGGLAFRNAIERENRGRFFRTNLPHFIGGAVLSVFVVIAVALLAGLSDDGVAVLMPMIVAAVAIGVFVVPAVRKALRGRSARAVIGAALGVVLAIVLLTLFAGAFLLVTEDAFPLMLAASVAGLNGLFFYLLRAPTAVGRKVMDQLEGFQLYLATAEKERLNMEAPDLTTERFEALLPYAVALDVERPWSDAFAAALARARPGDKDPMRHYRPAWRRGPAWRSANFGRAVASSIGGTTGTFRTALPRSSSSSSGFGGGGGSGGGGGGGGGGGW